MAKDFRNRCDLKGPTVTLFKIKDGDCIGGYTRSPWRFNDFDYDYDAKAMLFNLSRQRLFEHYQMSFSIIVGKSFGPVFTGNSTIWELSASEPFNGD